MSRPFPFWDQGMTDFTNFICSKQRIHIDTFIDKPINILKQLRNDHRIINNTTYYYFKIHFF
jgi:hypothetical protein